MALEAASSFPTGSTHGLSSAAADSPRFAVASGLVALALAIFSMPTTLGMGDSAELTLALALSGVTHPTGYPLYVIVGHVFVRAVHALGISWVLAASLWSAVGAAVAVGAFARCAQHGIAMRLEDDERAGRPPASPMAFWTALVFPVAALALNPVWLDSATKAEVYSWSHAALFLAAAFLMGRLRALSGNPSEPQGDHGAEDKRTAAIWGVLCGACASLHVLTLLSVVPMTAALVAAHGQRGRWRTSYALLGLVAAFVPLSSYAWIAWRAAHPASFQWPVEPTFASWWMHVRGAAYTHYLGRFSPTRSEWALIRAALLPAILPGMVIGPLLALRSSSSALRWGLLALLGGGALQIAFIVSYAVPDPASYFLPALMASLLVACPVLLWLARRISPAGALAVASALVLVLAAWSLPRAGDVKTQLARVDGGFRSAWEKIPFDRGIVLWADDHYHRFLVLQILEGRRPGLYVEDPDMLAWPARRRAFEDRFAFDPLDGMALRSEKDLERIPEIIRRRATVPVLVLPQ